MGSSIVRSLAFQPPPSSYTDYDLKDLFFIPKNVPPNKQDPENIGIPAIFYTYPKADFTIIFTHGNAEDLGMISPWMEILSSSMGVNILVYDYTGYGLNFGECSEDNCFIDIRSVYDYLINTKKINPSSIILYGRSLGSGPTCYLGATLFADGSTSLFSSLFTISNKSEPNKKSNHSLPIAGVILQSPVASCVRVLSDALSHVPFTDLFVNINRIDKIKVPIFIMHGTNDGVVPFGHGQMLFAKCLYGWRFLEVPGAGHNNIETSYIDLYTANLREFIAYLKVHYSKNTVTTPIREKEVNSLM